MKKYLTLLLIIGATVVCMHCSKSNDPTANNPNNPNNPNPNNPNPNPNTPGGSEITVTSISPDIIYASDVITITGTGFNPDPAKDTFQMGTIYSGFAPYQAASNSGDASFKILSASETQLVVQAVDPQYIDFQVGYETKRPWPFRIKANGKKLVSGFKKVRRMPFCIFERDHNTNVGTGCSFFLCPGDTMFSDGARGLYGATELYINGVLISGAKFPDSTKMRARIPKTLFGDTHDDCVTDQFDFKIINGDGRSVTRKVYMSKSPPMFLNGASFDQTTYSRSNGGVAKLTITGYSLYSSCEVKIKSLDYEAVSSLGVGGGFPNQAVIDFGVGGLPHNGTYSVFIRRNSTADWSFPIASFFATD